MIRSIRNQAVPRSGPYRVAVATVPAYRAYVTGKEHQNISPAQYCQDTVRKFDSDHFLTGLFVRKSLRAHYYTLRALNIATAQVADSVSDPKLGAMRLQFWRDTINQVAKQGTAPGQPVAQALLGLAKDSGGKLPVRWLLRVIDERAKRISDRPFTSLQDVEDYGEQVQASLLYASLEMAGVRDVHSDHAASHLGKCIALVNLIRGVLPMLEHKRKCLLPIELMAKHKVTTEGLVRGDGLEGLTEVIFDAASEAHIHLQTARSFADHVNPAAAQFLRSAVAMDKFLTDLQKNHFNVMDPDLTARSFLLPFQFHWAHFRSRY
eukprot:Clim_evm16s88 gene=Clim_evmTU16s88